MAMNMFKDIMILTSLFIKIRVFKINTYTFVVRSDNSHFNRIEC